MKTTKYICGLALAAATLTLGSCTNEAEITSAQESSLELEVSRSSRAPIYGNELPNESVFSIACVNLINGNAELRKVDYTKGQTQIQGDPVMLRNDTVYQAFALYPAPENLDELNKGGIYVNSLDGVDYMVAHSDELTYDNSWAYLEFKHILSMLRINVIKSDFISEDYLLNFIGIDKLYCTGWYQFNEEDFIKTDWNSPDIVFNQELKTDSYITKDVLVVPSESDEMTLHLYFENKSLSLTFKHKPFEAGEILTLNLTVTADELKVTEQEVMPWFTAEEVEINTSIAAAGKAVDLGLSKLWADRNVGAFSVTEYGDYYPHSQSVSELWGEDWQAPTSEEIAELISNCTWNWVKKGSVNGFEVSGNGNSIFLPAAGWFDQKDGYYNNLNYSGLYMTAENGVALEFSKQGSSIGTSVESALLRSIRPVKVKK